MKSSEQSTIKRKGGGEMDYNINDFKTLEQTVFLMLSDDYKDRFKAEYAQLMIRIIKLENMLEKYAMGTLGFQPTCDVEILREQLSSMYTYFNMLEMRAKIEGITL